MAGSASATLKRAGVRGAGWALLAAALTAGVSYLQVDDPRNCSNKKGDAKTECRAYNKSIEDDKDDILINVLVAAGAALAGRVGGEGLYDVRRQRNNDVDDADVQPGGPGGGGGGGGGRFRDVEVRVDGVWHPGKLRSWQRADGQSEWCGEVEWNPTEDEEQTNRFTEDEIRPSRNA